MNVNVGRASKARDGGILPAEDNLWIESPIVSRDHALICLQQSEERSEWVS